MRGPLPRMRGAGRVCGRCRSRRRSAWRRRPSPRSALCAERAGRGREAGSRCRTRRAPGASPIGACRPLPRRIGGIRSVLAGSARPGRETSPRRGDTGRRATPPPSRVPWSRRSRSAPCLPGSTPLRAGDRPAGSAIRTACGVGWVACWRRCGGAYASGACPGWVALLSWSAASDRSEVPEPPLPAPCSARGGRSARGKDAR